MDFNRAPAQPAATAHPAATAAGGSRKNSNNVDNSKWGRIGVALVALLMAVFLVFAIIRLASGDSSNGESGQVDTNKLQAVFLNTGQVYFGNIKSLNSKYIQLSNIYYLQTSNGGSTSSTSTANTNVSLVKLGCELHEPYDKMVINQNSVTFWENLQDGGQVAKAVKTFQQQNPNGQKCAEQSSSANTNGATSAQPANNGTGAPATPTKP